jgi:hypothetical protein
MALQHDVQPVGLADWTAACAQGWQRATAC